LYEVSIVATVTQIATSASNFEIVVIDHLQNYNNDKRKVRKTHFSAAAETRPSEVKGTTI
jgi:hypothetical protein